MVARLAAVVVPARAEGPVAPPVAAPFTLPARAAFAFRVLAFHAGPAAFGRVPAFADWFQADLRPSHLILLDLVDLNRQLVSDVDGLLHRGEPLAAPQLGDVDHAVAPRQDVHERPEGSRLHDGAFVALAHLRQVGIHEGLDHLDGLLGTRALAGPDEHAAVVLDVDVGAGDGDDLVDALALGADHLADLVDRDLLHDDPGGFGRELPTRLGDGPKHCLQDEQPGFLRLLQGPGQDLGREAGDLGVELQCRHEVPGPGDLEVHVSKRVLGAQDVGQRDELATFSDEAHGDTGHRRLDRNAGVHE